ncbi:MAG: hypothetical protein H0T50_14220 [Gemmatimonadales bacterium]|nr:hypothetical protein [Gemmatimonadales bacterium]
MPEMNRREFAEAIALAALVPVLGTGNDAIPWRGTPAALGPAAGAPAQEPSGLAKALAAAIRAQYGDRLSEADLAVITRQIETGLERAEKVRRSALSNGDAPDFVFSATRSARSG